MVLKFCANLSFMFPEGSTLLDRYDLARKAGFRAVECSFPYSFTAEEVNDARTHAGLEQILINAYPGNWNKGDRGLAAIPGREADFKFGIERAIEYAKELHCKKIHIMAGSVENETAENLQVYKNNLRLAAKMLSNNDMIGVIEPINRNTIPNYYLSNFKLATSVIYEIDSPNLKLMLDIFHLQQITGNLTKNIQELLPIVSHIQIAQVPDRHEPNSPGEINYRYVLSLLDKSHYKGWIGLEYFPKTSTLESLDWIYQYGYDL